DLVIEAVFEDLAVKQDLFQSLSAILPPKTILASNTSSFSISELSRSVKHPERFLGLHFFYHAAKNRLVEIIAGDRTAPELGPRLLAFMERVGKDPITCKDAHGFVVNRFFVPWLNEAVRILEEEIADPGTIDRVACETFGCGMGPFALMNATGVPIAYHAQRTLEEAYGPFYAPATKLKLQMETGKNWDIPAPGEPDPVTDQQIGERLQSAVLFVCGQLLDEEVCTAGDISRGAGVGLRWSQTPVAMMESLGKEQVGKSIAAFVKPYGIAIPRSVALDMWEPDWVRSEIRGTVGQITINRPEGLNALNPVVMNQLERHFNRLDDHAEIRAIIITGRGKAFVAGADIKFFVDHIKRDALDAIVEFTRQGQRVFRRIDESKKQVVAMVNGLALGGGLELALAADRIIALKSARLAFPETGIGIYPGLGGTSRPVKRIGVGLTKYLVLTGQMITAQQAVEMGLIDAVVDRDGFEALLADPDSPVPIPPKQGETWSAISQLFETHAVGDLLVADDFPEDQRKWIKNLRYKAPVALRLAGELIENEAGPEAELDRLKEIFSTEDALAGLQAVLSGKRPVFKGA
ncbi:MAG: 3-hydroxyacyl-CoA dehydrogenase/enoyl-CoA hydratase family protein, partial [Fidelibacterota bacterium]